MLIGAENGHVPQSIWDTLGGGIVGVNAADTDADDVDAAPCWRRSSAADEAIRVSRGMTSEATPGMRNSRSSRNLHSSNKEETDSVCSQAVKLSIGSRGACKER